MRYVVEVMYDGTCFHGSQVQGDTPTVQLELNKALSTLFRKPIETYGASRTDEGVHALSNFYHFDLESEPPAELQYKCNAILPEGMAVKKIYRAVNPEFNCRFEALSRTYRYRIYKAKNPFLVNRAFQFPYKLRRDVLDETAAILKEYSLFESFSKRNSQSKTFICNIMQSHWLDVGDELHYIVEANRFLRGMVRGLVATQLHIARGSLTTADFRNIIDAQNCTKARFNVPGHGLYLEEVKYGEGVMVAF
ncbi:MAG: tRNA pseudouridine synthase A [Bacteroidota bacterium]